MLPVWKFRSEMQGNSILPLLNGQSADWQEEVFVQVSKSQVGRAVRTQRWKYGVIAENVPGWEAMNSDEYTEAYLYDLQSDPYELENLVGLESHQPVSEVMRQRLINRMLNAGESRPRINMPAIRHSGQRKIPEKEIYQ